MRSLPMVVGKPALICLALAACTSSGRREGLRLGTTTTVQASGALALLDSLWHGAPLATVIGPSGQILRAAAAGDLDVVITHAPALERRILVEPGRALLVCPFVTSRFAVVGPAADPAGIAAAPDAAAAFRRIARLGARGSRATFVSRGDSSGTHIKEIALWRSAGVTPGAGPARWYVESGADQATTLRLADERGAYALADLPTFARLAHGLSLRVLFAADTALGNPYTLYVVRSPAAGGAAREFARWALGPWRAALLERRLPTDGTPAFEPRPGEAGAGGRCSAPR